MQKEIAKENLLYLILYNQTILYCHKAKTEKSRKSIDISLKNENTEVKVHFIKKGVSYLRTRNHTAVR